MPWFVRVSSAVGRPLVLIAALIMSAPGEYHLAVVAGWSPEFALLMPVVLSTYAAVAASVATITRNKSALFGAGIALTLALSAQVTAHLIAAGHMAGSPGLVAAVSAVPPIVVAHMLHLAALRPKSVADTPDMNGQVDHVSGQVPDSNHVTGHDRSAEDLSVRTVSADPVHPAGEVAGGFPVKNKRQRTADKLSGHDPNSVRVSNARVRVSVDDVRAAVRAGHKTSADLATHFGVSERTARRYLSMTG